MLKRPIPIERMVHEFKGRHKTSHLFKIDNFSLLRKYEVEMIESSVFELCGYRMKINMYPNGSCGKENHICMSLENQDSRPFKYELYTVSQLERVWHSSARMVAKSSSTNEIITLISHVDLKARGFMIEDCIMLGVKLHGVIPSNSASAECFSLIEKPLNGKVTWMMTKFSSFDPTKPHRSNEFEIGNRKWRIEVYPRGDEEEKGKSFSVYLLADGFKDNVPKAKTVAIFNLRVLDQVHRNHIEEPVSGLIGEELLGYSNFMPLKKLCEPYLVKDKLYVQVEFEVMSVTNYC